MADKGGPRVLAERYLLLDRLGSGGMGTVWRATDRLLNRTVAVKEVHLRATELPEQAARVRREAHSIARISHPNVVNVYDLVNHDERLWLVMEFVDGPSLKEHIDATGPMSPSAVAEIGLHLLSALEAVHAAGALHRDVKPGNVLLRRDGRAVLCDFGIAALSGTDPLTATGAVVGSFEYIAPERLSDRPVGPPSDLFSLGVTLCVLLSGRSPFARPEAVGVLNAIVREKPEIPAAAGPLRPALEALLRKNPADRPSVAAASEMLRPLATTAPTARDLSGAVSVPRRRMIGVVALSAALLLAAVVTAGALMSRSTGGADAANSAQPSAGHSAQPSAGQQPSAGHSAQPSATGSVRVDDAMPFPDAPGQFWTFSGDRYTRVTVTASGYPVRKGEPDSASLQAWDDTFKNLPGFKNGIDATLRVPGSRNDYWVFSGNQYIRVRVADADQVYDDTLVEGPKPLSDWEDAFGGLPDDGIDAVMRTPDDPKQYWVFAGDQYVRTTLDGEGPSGHVTHGPAGLDGWPGTFAKVPGFTQGIDAVIPVPGKRNDYWVFSGTHYMKIRVTDEAYEDTVLEGPKPLRG